MMRGRVLADLDPMGVNGRHGRFEVTELLLLLAVKPALTAASSGLDYGTGLKEICHE